VLKRLDLKKCFGGEHMWEKLLNSKHVLFLCSSVAVLLLTISIFIGISAYQSAKAQCVAIPQTGLVLGGVDFTYASVYWNNNYEYVTCTPWGSKSTCSTTQQTQCLITQQNAGNCVTWSCGAGTTQHNGFCIAN